MFNHKALVSSIVVFATAFAIGGNPNSAQAGGYYSSCGYRPAYYSYPSCGPYYGGYAGGYYGGCGTGIYVGYSGGYASGYYGGYYGGYPGGYYRGNCGSRTVVVSRPAYSYYPRPTPYVYAKSYAPRPVHHGYHGRPAHHGGHHGRAYSRPSGHGGVYRGGQRSSGPGYRR